MHQFVAKIENEQDKCMQGCVSWSTAVKFLMARKFDLQRACDLFFAHEVFKDFNYILVFTHILVLHIGAIGIL